MFNPPLERHQVKAVFPRIMRPEQINNSESYLEKLANLGLWLRKLDRSATTEYDFYRRVQELILVRRHQQGSSQKEHIYIQHF